VVVVVVVVVAVDEMASTYQVGRLGLADRPGEGQGNLDGKTATLWSLVCLPTGSTVISLGRLESDRKWWWEYRYLDG
jgi:hypothetical protein